MYEILKVFVESIVKVIPFSSFSDNRRKKKLGKIGRDLFLLYSALNEIYVNGLQITEKLEDCADWSSKKWNSGDTERAYFTQLKVDLRRQKINLENAIGALHNVVEILNLIDSEAYSELQLLFGKKLSIIGGLKSSLESGELISLNEVSLSNALVAICANRRSNPNYFPPREVLQDGAIKLTELDNIEVVRHNEIQLFLRQAKPRERLQTIKTVLTRLREALEKNFSIEDVLLEVGDTRLSRR
jgi:hypothetical protein